MNRRSCATVHDGPVRIGRVGSPVVGPCPGDAAGAAPFVRLEERPPVEPRRSILVLVAGCPAVSWLAVVSGLADVSDSADTSGAPVGAPGGTAPEG